MDCDAAGLFKAFSLEILAGGQDIAIVLTRPSMSSKAKVLSILELSDGWPRILGNLRQFLGRTEQTNLYTLVQVKYSSVVIIDYTGFHLVSDSVFVVNLCFCRQFCFHLLVNFSIYLATLRRPQDAPLF